VATWIVLSIVGVPYALALGPRGGLLRVHTARRATLSAIVVALASLLVGAELLGIIGACSRSRPLRRSRSSSANGGRKNGLKAPSIGADEGPAR
jgi:hypothetical protein